PPELCPFFARLSVFRGGGTGAAAGAVCKDEGGRREGEAGEREKGKGERNSTPDSALSTQHSALNLHPSSFILHPSEVLDCLMQLQAHSLVTAREVGGTMRFSMLETLREFTAEQLSPAEREEARKRHTAYFL